MEGNSNMVVSERIIPPGHPNRPGTKLESVRALIFHYTGNEAPGADAEANARYFGRTWRGDLNKPTERDGAPFRYGSTQVICDMDQTLTVIPVDEAAWACGDRPLPFDPVFKGQPPLANEVFGNRQNYRSISVEICNNDAIRNSNSDWEAACSRAIAWAVSYCRKNNLRIDTGLPRRPPAPGSVFLLRHHDVTSKACPLPLLDEGEWGSFCSRIIAQVGEA